MKNNELTQISKITDRIFVSGVYPLDDDVSIIKKLDIKYILCCVDKKFVADVHNKIILDNPNVTILYLPYNDDTYQNLWQSNKDIIKMTSYMTNNINRDKLFQMMNLYQNKPMIEIGYHFIDIAVSDGQNILVHCMAGISRSVSLVVYFLMKKYHLPFNLAYEKVRTLRTIAAPNSSFKSQLIKYEQMRDKFTEEDANNCIKTGVKSI